MPSARSVMWGIIFGLLAVWLATNVGFIGGIVGPRNG